MKRTRCIAIAALALGVLAAVPSAQAQTKKISYAIYELSPLVSSHSTSVREINNSGQVVGYVSDGTIFHVCIWDLIGGAWVVRDLGGYEYYPNAYLGTLGIGINEDGDVVGYTNTLLGHPGEAFVYDDVNDVFETLPGLEGISIHAAVSINNVGGIIGFSRDNDRDYATFWEQDEYGTWGVTNLAEASPAVKAFSGTGGINDYMQVVGNSFDARNDYTTQVAHLWERDANGDWTVTNLPGYRPGAGGINNFGQIMGTHEVNGARHACIWQLDNGQWKLTDLSVFASGFSSTDARDINELGQVVGQARFATGYTTPYLYANGVMNDLKNFLPTGSGWSLGGAWAINDYGKIVGYGDNPAGQKRGFLMDTKQATYSYTSTGSAVSIKDKSTASKAMTLTDNVTITDLNVKVTLYHTRYADLQIDLVGPDNVTRTLCRPGGVTGSGTKTLVFDDEGAAGTIIPPDKVLHLYDGTSTAGKWTLKITDTVKNYKTGSFTSFTLDVVPVMPEL